MTRLNYNRPIFKKGLIPINTTPKQKKIKYKRHSILSPGLINDLFLEALKNNRPSTRKFVESLYTYFKAKKGLSFRQIDCLKAIIEEQKDGPKI